MSKRILLFLLPHGRNSGAAELFPALQQSEHDEDGLNSVNKLAAKLLPTENDHLNIHQVKFVIGQIQSQ